MAAVAAPGPGRVVAAPPEVAARRAVVGRLARVDRRVRSTRRAPEVAPMRVSDAASGSVAPETRAATTAAGQSQREIGPGRRRRAPGVAGDAASGGPRGHVRIARVARAGPAAVGRGTGLPARGTVVHLLAAAPAGDAMTSGRVRRRLPGRVTGARPAVGLRSGAARRPIARPATSPGGHVPRARPSTGAVSTGLASTGLARIVRRSAGPGRTAVVSVDRRRTGRGRPRHARRRRSDRRSRNPTSWPRTRSSSPDGARSRRRSSRAGPPVASSSSRNAGRRSSASSCTRRACGSRSWRSKAGR